MDTLSKSFLLILFLVFPLLSWSQTNETKAVKKEPSSSEKGTVQYNSQSKGTEENYQESEKITVPVESKQRKEDEWIKAKEEKSKRLSADPTHGESVTPKIQFVKRSDFNSLPKARQEYILAHSEQFVIVD